MTDLHAEPGAAPDVVTPAGSPAQDPPAADSSPTPVLSIAIGVAALFAASWWLVSWLTALPRVLTPLERFQVIALLDDPASWAETVPVGTGDGLMERFTVLDNQMRSARLQRLVLAPLEVVVGLGVSAYVAANLGILLVGAFTGR